MEGTESKNGADMDVWNDSAESELMKAALSSQYTPSFVIFSFLLKIISVAEVGVGEEEEGDIGERSSTSSSSE